MTQAFIGETGPKDCLYVKRTIPVPSELTGVCVLADSVLVFVGGGSSEPVNRISVILHYT